MSNFIETIRRHFLSGVLVVVPFILTFIVLRFLFKVVDGALEPVLHGLLGYYRTGLGLLTTILIILLAGLLTRNLVGHRLYRIGDRLVARMPIIRPIYSASKQLLEAVASKDIKSFKEVALIEYPRRGTYGMCLVSKRLEIDVSGRKKKYATCFVPSTPTPVSGMVIMVPEEDIIPVDLTVEEGLKFLVSGGVTSPDLISRKTTTGSFSDVEVNNEIG